VIPQLIGKNLIIVVLFSIVGIQSCKYDVEEELYPSTPCETNAMSYQTDIVPILTNNGCISCHGDLATLDLNGYSDLKIYVDNEALLGSIKHRDGFRKMPDNQPKLDQCTIDKIESWIYDGALNN
ncbi:MAG: hypothetical protein KJP21_02450, partial [Bacteroidia bacterium]|nr:hypothetical protein [Bacteroidia bacterium]